MRHASRVSSIPTVTNYSLNHNVVNRINNSQQSINYNNIQNTNANMNNANVNNANVNNVNANVNANANANANANVNNANANANANANVNNTNVNNANVNNANANDNMNANDNVNDNSFINNLDANTNISNNNKLLERIEKLETFYGKEIDSLTRSIAILKEQFNGLENGYRNISSALTNIVDELERSPDEDIVISKVDSTLNIKEVETITNLNNEKNNNINRDDEGNNYDNK
jgi:hypothetical protein